MKTALGAMFLLLVVFSGFAAGESESEMSELTELTLVLDWTPNTNHTGAYVAQALDYFAEEGLDVIIEQAVEASAESIVGAGSAEFAFSYQEAITFARTADSPIPVVAIAAVIQHNTSGFAAPQSKNIKSPADFVGKRYGGWGTDLEYATIDSLMKPYGESAESVEFVNIGSADFFQAVERDIDFAWIFWGWTGIEAQSRGLDLDFIRLSDFDPVFDYYTPVIISSEQFIDENAELTRAFIRALQRGYEYAIQNPQEAAEILVKAADGLDQDWIASSQWYLQTQYQAEIARWGEMKTDVWQRYADWMLENGFIGQPLDVSAAFTNDYLPEMMTEE